MKACIISRIQSLEKSAKCLNADFLFEEWFCEHSSEGGADYWGLLEIVPDELRLQCLFRIFKENRENQASAPLST